MFRDETEAVFKPRWEEHRQTIPEEDQYRFVVAFRTKIARELYDAAPPDVRERVDAERMKGRPKTGAENVDESGSDSDEEGELDGETKEAKAAKAEAKAETKAATRAEKQLQDDLDQANEYQQ